MISTTMTDQEWFEFNETITQEGSDRLETIFNIENEVEDQLKSAERTEELLREQIFFANTLLEEIEEAMEEPGRKADLIKNILAIIDNSSFER